MSAQRVSLIMPVFDGSAYVLAALASIREPSGLDLEIIVVDDGSTDDTLARVRHAADGDRRIRIIERPHGGVAAARNTGLAAASGSHIAFLDADDLSPPGRIARQLSRLDERPDIAGTVGHAIWFNALDDRSEPLPGSLWVRRLDICLGNLMVPRRTFERFGSFNDALLIGEDLDFYFRMFEADAPLLVEAATTNYHRKHGASLTSDQERTHQLSLMAFRLSLARRRQRGKGGPVATFFGRSFDTDQIFIASADPAWRALDAEVSCGRQAYAAE